MGDSTVLMVKPNGKRYPAGASFALFLPIFLMLAGLLPDRAAAWTLADLNPWRQIRERRIFSLTRANPVGVRVLVVPVLDEPINAPVYTRLASDFCNSLRSFANEVWLITDLPNNPVKAGFYNALPHILADYRLRNYLDMDLLKKMIPDFECDYIALFEVTDYDRFWIDEDLQMQVCVRTVMYDYEDGQPRLEKFYCGARGRRLEEGTSSEAERIAIKGLVKELEDPLRRSVAERELELERRCHEVATLAALTSQREWAIHKTDLANMQNQVSNAQEQARDYQSDLVEQRRLNDQLQQELESIKGMLEEMAAQQAAQPAPSSDPPPSFPAPGARVSGNPNANSGDVGTTPAGYGISESPSPASTVAPAPAPPQNNWQQEPADIWDYVDEDPVEPITLYETEICLRDNLPLPPR